jgi:hypothetical protein
VATGFEIEGYSDLLWACKLRILGRRASGEYLHSHITGRLTAPKGEARDGDEVA